MEKDNFEEQLRQVVQRAELANNGRDRERVWANVNPQKRSKKGWFYAVAAILVIGFSFALIFNRESSIPVADLNVAVVPNTIEPKSKLQMGETPAPIKSVEKASVKARSIIPTGGKETIPAPVKEESARPMIAQIEEQKQFNNPIADNKLTIPNNLQQSNNSTIVANPAIAGNPILVDAIPTGASTEFTAQFKRGALVDPKIEEAVTLKKFRLKKDTSYLANAVEKQSMKIRLSFKKEN